MKKIFVSFFALLLIACCTQPQPPIAKKIAHESVICGNTLSDNYFWMRLSDEQKSAETPDAQTQDVLDFLNAENAYAESEFLNPNKKLINTLYEEMKSRIMDVDLSVPTLNNGYKYYTRYEAGKDYPQYYRCADKEGAQDELILDVNLLAEGKSFCNVRGVYVSPNNNLVAYCADFMGRNRFTLYVKDLTTGELLKDEIGNMAASVAWGGDNKTLYYVGKDINTLRADKVYRHTLGADPSSEDEMIYFEEDETFAVNLSTTIDHKYIIINASQTMADEAHYLEANDVTGQFKCFAPRERGVNYDIDHNGDKFYIRTNLDGAQNFAIMTCDDKKIDRKNWKMFVPAGKEILNQGFSLFNDYIVLNEGKEANMTIRVINLSTLEEHYIDFDDSCFSAYVSGNAEANTTTLRYTYTSMSSPAAVYDYNMATREKTMLKEIEVPGYVREDYQVERVWATARDGVKVPISLIYKKGFVKDGTGKVFLYSYGSYGSSTNPGFNSNIFSLLDRGFVYAIAHIRGGSEMGRQWYEDGKLLKKMNTFNDFNDCARYLISENYTTSNNMFIEGASAGGLLMGAVVNLEPELYKGVIAGVPFVDVINTMADETIPLTTFEWDEWGDPRVEPYFSYMLSYSPYDQVEAKDYPNIMVTSGYWDSQVQYWEPAKWVAKLREFKTDSNQLIFLCDMEAGHGGASGRYKRLINTARQYAFFLSLVE